MSFKPLTEIAFNRGMMSSLPDFDPGLAGTFAPGSRNQIMVGRRARPWKGLGTKGANTGGRKMLQVGKTWGQIKDIGMLLGSGSFFEDIGRTRWGIGSGRPGIEGTDMTGFDLSTILQVAVPVAGVYDASHVYDAGLPQPSTPDVAVLDQPGAGYAGIINGPVSFKIARLRLTTGARSIASLTSAVLLPANNSVRLTFPAASSGQTHWRVFSTQEGFGGIGLHYALRYGIGTAGVLDIPESVVAAGSAGGVGRSLEFDFHTGDLVPELAYIYDFPPPAGTHAVRIDNVMVVLGVAVDSTSAVTSTNTGTAGSCSEPNFYESHDPRHRIYFSEQIVDHRARQTDSYVYVAFRNAIMAIQYVGPRDGPAVAVTAILPEVGISKSANWCQVGGLLYMRLGDGSFVRMRADGSLDYGWADDIYELIKDWDDNTVIEWHPDTMSVIAANGSQAFSFSLLTEQWSPTCAFADAGVAGTALSAIHSQGELIITITNAGAQTAYAWDTGAATMAITSMTPWFRAQARSARVREMMVAFENDRTTDPLIISVHRNGRRTYIRDAQLTNGSNVITSATAPFDAAHTGDLLCAFGAGIGAGGKNYLLGRMVYGAANSVTLIDPVTGAALNAQASLSDVYCVLARNIVPYVFTRKEFQHSDFIDKFRVFDAQSYAVGFNMLTNTTMGQIVRAEVLGTLHNGRHGVTV
jgi:hypothetical protein